jgi:hypothetical protein
MIMRSSLNLLSPMGEAVNLTGDPVRGAGWYGPNTGLHSVAIRVLNFQGRISVQASLAASPSELDWFSVLPNNVLYWQYPTAGYILKPSQGGETSNIGFNFTCNVIWVRAIVDRTYFTAITETPIQASLLGTVDSILLNY